MTPENPFPDSDPDRRAIWEMLVIRDTRAFCAVDWTLVEGDFCQSSFVGVRGASQLADWQIAFPSLSDYRDAWLDRARHCTNLTLVNGTLLDFLFSASNLTSIDIQGSRALARKTFNGDAGATSGETLSLHWQTAYLLRKDLARWRITGFVGYLPSAPQP